MLELVVFIVPTGYLVGNGRKDDVLGFPRCQRHPEGQLQLASHPIGLVSAPLSDFILVLFFGFYISFFHCI